jgi:hypothetical protein
VPAILIFVEIFVEPFMQFLFPQILYGLFALAIPIIVHLFQLRKFKPEPFTNVVFLKKLIVSSRKSSKLKKWLSLITRLLIISCLVLAFAQPYFPNPEQKTQKKQISIFLDNSYSMSLNGEVTALFNQAKEELLEVLPENETYNLSTHNESFKNLRTEDLKSILYEISYTNNPLDLNSILTKTESLFNANSNSSENELIVLSDFQNLKNEDSLKLKEAYNYHFVKYNPQEKINFSIDTVFLETSADENALKFKISCSEKTSQNLPVSIYDGERLLSKISLDYNETNEKTYVFNLEENDILNGKINIEDKGLSYDNTLFFTLKKPDPIEVLVISETVSPYLDKIFNKERFNYKQTLINKLEYEDINSADVVILNELKQLPNALNIAIENYTKTNRVLCIVPNRSINLSSYNVLFKNLGITPFSTKNNTSIKLTNINFDHPIFQGVFTEDIDNFDYPTFESYYQSTNPEKALSFSNNMPLLESNDKVFRFNAAIEDNSNLKQSPLVVLSFYNMALRAQNKQKLYLENDDNYTLKLSKDMNQDEVLSLYKDDFSFIPRQEINGREIRFSFKEYPQDPGHYAIINSKQDTLSLIAFNPYRKESLLNYFELNGLNNINTYSNFGDYTQNFYENYNIESLWKWFIVLALIFMIIELLLLRFIK